MSYRTMGRQFDWDLEKYRKADKPADKGNKKRFMKNFARFVKNPYGYAYWKLNMPKRNIGIFPALVGLTLVTSFLRMVSEAKEQKKSKGFLQYLGAQEDITDDVRLDGNH